MHRPSDPLEAVSLQPRWYEGISRYQWLVLAIASAGWIFDAFEGQLFNLMRPQMLGDLLHVASGHPEVRRWGDIFLAAFLVGGTVGGVFFGWLGDRLGRGPVMMITILMYSIFSGLTYFANSLTEVGVLRFLVAVGVGGEWCVAAALVSEIMPGRARAHTSGIFHASSTFGAWIAAAAGLAAGAQWRWAFLIGVAPSLLVLWVRAKVREPESWREAKDQARDGTGKALGSFRELLGRGPWRRSAWLGLALGTVGLASFWGVTIAGQDLTADFLKRHGVPEALALEKAKFAFGVVEILGAGLGMLAFGPLCVRLGRRMTFVLYQAVSLVVVPAFCFLPQSYGVLLALLPVYGFFTWGPQAGFAIYFPELFPARLRSTGAGFCFNGGRLLASSVLVFSGWLKGLPGLDLRMAVTLMSSLFLIGIVIALRLPETKGKTLPE